MTELKLRYNLINLFFHIFLLVCGGLGIGLLFFGVLKKLPDYFIAVLIISLFIYQGIRIIRHKSFDLILDNERLTLKRPLIGGGKSYTRSDIQGFSKSEVKNGAGNGSYLSTSDSIIVYFKQADPIELTTRSYPLRFDEIEPALRELGIPYLGEEPYNVTFFGKRLYKYPSENG